MLVNVATKSDLENLATKDDVKKLDDKLDYMTDKLDNIEKHFLNKQTKNSSDSNQRNSNKIRKEPNIELI